MNRTKKNDKILIIAVLIIALIAGGGLLLTQKSAEGGMAIVTIDGEEHGRYPLSKDILEKIELADGSYNIFEIKDGMVDITEASCPDKICVEHRKISKTNQSIVCLPNKVIISIENGAETEIDFMTN